jgi:RNA polymerase sigma-70 factor (ECF subfamily)
MVSAGRQAERAAEQAARTSYGRLLAYLTARSRDIAGAEDALAEAFASALRTWPERGVPANPDAWLLVAARRQLGHGRRRRQTAKAGQASVELLMEEAQQRMDDQAGTWPIDDRLKLLFVCAHPAIDPAVRTALMLQTVLGLPVERLADAFLVAPATLGQRLVRAKAKIRDAGLAFRLPEPGEWPERLGSVTAAVGAAYGLGWDDIDSSDDQGRDLTGEAIWLARATAALLPDEPEAKALLAFMLYMEARRAARRNALGALTPLEDQDVGLWDAASMDEADRLLAQAGQAKRFGRFQCEAAIQAVHCDRRHGRMTNYAALVALYDALRLFAPTIGVEVSRAAALGGLQGPAAALEELGRIGQDDVAGYQPYWACRAHFLAQLGRAEQADDSYRRAIGLSASAPVKAFLEMRRSALFGSAS